VRAIIRLTQQRDASDLLDGLFGLTVGNKQRLLSANFVIIISFWAIVNDFVVPSLVFMLLSDLYTVDKAVSAPNP